MLTLNKYSDKSVVVRGDTEMYEHELSSLHGKLNSKLKNGGPGWIFSLLNLNQLESFVNSVNSYREESEVISENNNMCSQYQTLTYDLPLPVINSKVTIIFPNSTVQYKINNIGPYNDTMVLQGSKDILFSSFKGGQWQIDNESETHNIVFN
ncbi:MAG: hypothetical protein QM487_02835 [Candidatus Marithrix sp.]